MLREVFFSSPLYMALLRQRDAAGVVGSNTSEDSRVCRSCGPVGQVGPLQILLYFVKSDVTALGQIQGLCSCKVLGPL